MSHVFRRPDPLPHRRSQVHRIDAEPGERDANVLCRRKARRGTERRSHQSGGAETERQGPQRPRRQSRIEHDRTQRRQRDQPRGEDTNRTDELRAGHRDRCCHTRNPQLRESPT